MLCIVLTERNTHLYILFPTSNTVPGLFFYKKQLTVNGQKKNSLYKGFSYYLHEWKQLTKQYSNQYTGHYVL